MTEKGFPGFNEKQAIFHAIPYGVVDAQLAVFLAD